MSKKKKGAVRRALVTPDTVPVKVGLADNTTLPVPVLEVTPVPPFATGKVPETSLVKLTSLPTSAAFTILLFESNPKLPPDATVPEDTSSK